ncbi:uncharacterized protein G2W53_004997 [Senna tora]|uniref:Uncharacterized protein n=1 Tax=Senna tora TaxID=362788 RepID=A0A835CHQ1_9FABA|nr:uncharacterized protein G2W53_004997 [Senna tora]
MARPFHKAASLLYNSEGGHAKEVASPFCSAVTVLTRKTHGSSSLRRGW